MIFHPVYYGNRIKHHDSFLDVPDIRKGLALPTKVYRKHINIACYLNCVPNHPPHVKRGIIQSLHNAASTMYQE
jgi:hypothetical protein